MKLFQSKPKTSKLAAGAAEASTRVDRRSLVVGAGVAGAAAVAAQAFRQGAAVAPDVTVGAKVLPEAGDGYQVTPHVLRYYETAKV